MRQPRFMIAAPASGSGKTMVTCGILQALTDRGLKLSSFKCGPDYIDPMFHSKVIGARSRNLDCFFTGDETLRYLFCRSADGTDISVVEGVMGFYDGRRSSDSDGSSCDVSLRTGTPVILLVNCRGSALSSAAVVKGFKEFRENNIRGVILNNMSSYVYEDVKPVIEKETGLKVVGYVPKMTDINLESRHLGLVMPDEIQDLRDALHTLAGRLEETLDIDAILEIARAAPEIEGKAPEHGVVPGTTRIAFADDDAFCFTYEDNLALLRECGAELVPFSPIRDKALPEGVGGLILSGGYPELHGAALESNRSMLADIRAKAEGGMPILAECGGFMYLHKRMEDADGVMREMAGVIDGEVTKKGKLTRFGYVTLYSDNPDSVIAGGARGHEFHYWDSSNCGDSWKAVKSSGKTYGAGHDNGIIAAGFPHLYYYSNPDIAYRFVSKCSAYLAKH